MSLPSHICGVPVEGLAEWSEPEVQAGVLVRYARPSRWYYVLQQRVPDKLRKAGIALHRKGSVSWLVQTLDAPPPVPVERPLYVRPLKRLPGVNATRLLEWQVVPLQRLKYYWLRGQRALADLSDTGVGKTYVALGLARELRRRVKVVTKKNARIQWMEAAAHMGVECEAWNYEALKTGRHPWVRWKLVRPSNGGPPQEWPEWRVNLTRDLVIFDEGHNCGGIDHTLNSKLMLMAAWRGVPLHILSATLAHSPVRMRAPGYALGLHDNTDFFPWLRAHGCIQFGDTWLFNNDHAVMRDIHEDIFNRCAVRVRRHECPGFPESVEEAVLMDFPEKLAREWSKVTALLDATRERADSYADAALAKVMAARQMSEAVKVRAAVEMAREAALDGFRVALFFNFEGPMRTAAELLDCPMIRGGQKAAERDALRKAFCADKLPYLCLNNESGGTAMSLHGGRPRWGIHMPTWRADTLRQALGRLPRAGGNYCRQTILFAAGTVEEDICQSVRAKLRNLDTLNDGDTQGPFVMFRLAPKTRKRKEPES